MQRIVFSTPNPERIFVFEDGSVRYFSVIDQVWHVVDRVPARDTASWPIETYVAVMTAVRRAMGRGKFVRTYAPNAESRLPEWDPSQERVIMNRREMLQIIGERSENLKKDALFLIGQLNDKDGFSGDSAKANLQLFRRLCRRALRSGVAREDVEKWLPDSDGTVLDSDWVFLTALEYEDEQIIED